MSRVLIRRPLPSIAWAEVTYTGAVPRWLGQRRIHFDLVSGRALTYSMPQGTGGIYSGTMFALNPLTLVATRLGGTDSPNHNPAPDYPDSTAGSWNNGDGSDIQPWLSDRHPEFQSAIDTLRNVYWQWSGLAFGNPPEGDGLCYNDLWSYALNVTPTANRWTKHVLGNTPTVQANGVLWYDSDIDLLVLHGVAGNPCTWIYAPSDTLSADQTTAGCVTAKTWTLVYSPVSNIPVYSYYANAVYAPTVRKGLLFGWDQMGSSDSTLQIWAFDALTSTWTNKNPANLPHQREVDNPEYAIAYLSSGLWAGNVHFHRTTHTSTADTSEAADYFYNPSANVISRIDATGFGPSKIALQDFIPSLGVNGVILSHEGSGGKFYHGVFS